MLRCFAEVAQAGRFTQAKRNVCISYMGAYLNKLNQR
jgi:hypothetical protein